MAPTSKTDSHRVERTSDAIWNLSFLPKSVHRAGDALIKVLSFFFFGVLFLVVLPFGLYEELNESGWITHSHDTPVWIQGDWLVGEYRECDMQTTTPAFEGNHYDAEDLKTLPRLFCAAQPNGFFDWSESRTGTDVSWQTISRDFHTLPVSYHGRIDRTDKWRISWRCQRNTDSLTCKAED